MKLIEDKISDLRNSNKRLEQLIKSYQMSTNNEDTYIIINLMIYETYLLDNLRDEVADLLRRYAFLLEDPQGTLKSFIETLEDVNSNVDKYLQLIQ